MKNSPDSLQIVCRSRKILIHKSLDLHKVFWIDGEIERRVHAPTHTHTHKWLIIFDWRNIFDQHEIFINQTAGKFFFLFILFIIRVLFFFVCVSFHISWSLCEKVKLVLGAEKIDSQKKKKVRNAKQKLRPYVAQHWPHFYIQKVFNNTKMQLQQFTFLLHE